MRRTVAAAVMTLHKLTAGDGYLYLMRHIAKADADPATHPGAPAAAGTAPTPDAAAYYTAPGNPPGVWLGKGASVLGLAGAEGGGVVVDGTHGRGPPIRCLSK